MPGSLLALLLLAGPLDAARVASKDPPSGSAPQDDDPPDARPPALAQLAGRVEHTQEGWKLKDAVRVGLRVRCANLPPGSHAVSMVFQHVKKVNTMKHKNYTVVTETIENEPNPVFATQLSPAYQFSVEQRLEFVVRGSDDQERDPMMFTASLGSLLHTVSRIETGELTFSLCQGESVPLTEFRSLARDRVGCMSGPGVEHGGHPSTCTLYGFDQAASAATLGVRLRARGLANTDWTSNSDPYVQIYASRPGRRCHLDHKSQFTWKKGRPVGTESPDCLGPIPIKSGEKGPVKGVSTHVVRNNLNPDWGFVEIPVGALCDDQFYREVSIVVWDDDGGHSINPDTLIGSMTVPAQALKSFHAGEDMGRLGKRSHEEDRGHLLLASAERAQKVTIGQYLSGGVEIEVMMAIDLTGSNTRQGTYDEQQRGGLHALRGKRLNGYQAMIRGVADILGQYDTDGHIPLMSFGGRHYTTDPPDPEQTELLDNYTVPPDDGSAAGWHGAEGLLRGYEKEIERCLSPTGYKRLGKIVPCFSGPTRFTDVIRIATEEAQEASADGSTQVYKVLVVLTDGDESAEAVPDTLSQIAEASKYGLSVLMVGIGDGSDENFADLRALDERACNARSDARDIVQTVVVKDIEPERLFFETLEELPAQIISYYYDAKHLIPSASFAGVVPLLAGRGGDGLILLSEVERLVQRAEREELVEKGLRVVPSPPKAPSCVGRKGEEVRVFKACYVGGC